MATMTMIQVMNMMLAFASVSLVATVARLIIRKRKNWGWDDLFAVFALLSIMAQAIMMNMRVRGTFIKGARAAADVYYLNGVFFYLQDWAARLSILFTLIRICPNPITKKYLLLCAALFLVATAVNIGLLVGFCHADETWAKKIGLCPLNKAIPWVQMATGIAADIVLVYVPIEILRALTSAPALRRRLQTIFSVTVILTFACIIQSVFVIKSPGLKVLIASSAEGFVAILLCNFTILITAVIHLFKIDEEELTTIPSLRRSSIVFGKGSRDTDSTGSQTATLDITASGTQKSTRGHSFMDRWSVMDIDSDLGKDLKVHSVSQDIDLENRSGRSSVRKQASFLSERDQARTV